MNKSIVIGIDGGGTYTRIMAADTDGRVVAYAEHGCCNPNKDPLAKQNVHAAIRDMLEQTEPHGRIAALFAGLAGLDGPKDLSWAEAFTDYPGLACSKWHENDAVVAHAGAHLTEPGIIAISGTGSIVFGISESGQRLRNYDFYHYADTAARHLAYDAVYRIIAGNAGPADEPFVNDVLAYWNVRDVGELARLGSTGFTEDNAERIRLFSRMAPQVTKAAEAGVPLGVSVCEKAISALDTGIRLTGSCFEASDVRVAFIGGVIRSPYIRRGLAASLALPSNKRYVVSEPVLSPAAGAVLKALQHYGSPITEATINNLLIHPKSRPELQIH